MYPSAHAPWHAQENGWHWLELHNNNYSSSRSTIAAASVRVWTGLEQPVTNRRKQRSSQAMYHMEIRLSASQNWSCHVIKRCALSRCACVCVRVVCMRARACDAMRIKKHIGTHWTIKRYCQGLIGHATRNATRKTSEFKRGRENVARVVDFY